MDNNQKAIFQSSAKKLVQNLSKRGMSGYYCYDSKDCVEQILALIPKGSTIGWGGSQSLIECGLMEALCQRKEEYTLYDRSLIAPENLQEFYGKLVTCDYFLMSTNAITYDGELVNVDGSGNRVACLIHGPSNVIVITGMNKLTSSITTAYDRVKNIASPCNAKRLHKNTPCCEIGKCSDCFSPDCICSNTVITRRSAIPNRIKVFLVGEPLGY